jgi:hypothetical protein
VNIEKEELNYDFKTDNSVAKYVDDKIHYEKLDYIPENG